MGVVSLKAYGSFNKTESFLKKMSKMNLTNVLNTYGGKGVSNLQALTPKNTGKTAMSWRYEVRVGRTSASVAWYNDNVNDGVPIALVIEYGHGTGWGGYVPPHPYINQALQPVFEELSNVVWREVENG